MKERSWRRGATPSIFHAKFQHLPWFLVPTGATGTYRVFRTHRCSEREWILVLPFARSGRQDTQIISRSKYLLHYSFRFTVIFFHFTIYFRYTRARFPTSGPSTYSKDGHRTGERDSVPKIRTQQYRPQWSQQFTHKPCKVSSPHHPIPQEDPFPM